MNIGNVHFCKQEIRKKWNISLGSFLWQCCDYDLVLNISNRNLSELPTFECADWAVQIGSDSLHFHLLQDFASSKDEPTKVTHLIFNVQPLKGGPVTMWPIWSEIFSTVCSDYNQFKGFSNILIYLLVWFGRCRPCIKIKIQTWSEPTTMSSP